MTTQENLTDDISDISALSETEFPTVSFSVDKTVIVEGGDPQLLTFNLSQPAPAGGLEVNLLVDDPDGDEGAGDTNFPPELISNITDFGQVDEDGVTTASLTIAEGATVATFGVAAFEDDQVEGDETYSFTLLENENYTVDPTSTTITTTIEEFIKPTVSIFPEIVLSTEGDSFVWNFSLDEPVPEGGLTLNIVVTQNTESKAGDATFNFEASTGITDFDFLFGENDILLGFTVGLAEGVTQASLVGDTTVDNIPETDEIGLYTIADGEDYRADPNQNSLINIFTDRTVVTLTTDEVNVTEGETFAWNFSLNQPAPEGGLTLSLPITLNNDPEPGDVDYNIEGSNNIEDFGFIIEDDVSIGFTLTIPEGETVATLVSEAVIDDIAEFDEIFTTVLADGNDYVANPVSNQVVTTIAEDGVAPPSSAPVVSITPEILISTEGDTFAWDITLDQPVPEGGLTLNLPITQNNDPEPGDVIYNVEGSTGITDFDFIVEDNISIGFSVTLAEGVTSATLVSETVADDNDIEEAADEIFTTVLADGVDYRANPDSNEVVTVLTREPVVTLTTDEVNVTEGDTFAWNFSLNQPAPEGGLTLSLPITFNNDPEPGDVDYNVEGSTNITDFSFLVVDDISVGFNVTIAEGETVATLVSQAVADDLEEIDEIFTTILNDGEDYRANPVSREVVTTILEPDLSATPTVSLTPATVTATEGETFAWNFTLDQPAPVGGLSLFLPITDDSDPAPGDVEYFVEGSNNISDFEFVTTSSISQIYAFGDSYSDDGLSFEISTDAVNAGVPGSFILPADPELGLYDDEGRWTNGPTAVEVLSETLDVELTDYAVGGAKSGAGNYYNWLDSFQDTGVFGQIDQFSTELSEASADPDALYFIFASANDLFEYADFGLPGTVEELAAQTVENIVAGVTDLSELGAEQFLVVNSSDLDILPGIIEFGQVEEATVFTDEVNELLPEALAAISQELGVEIALYDHVAISDEIRSNPADFGLTNIDDPYQPVFPPEPTPTDAEPDEYYFWDEYHPTARTHEIIGEDMASFVGSEFEDDDVSVGFNVTIAEGATEATLVSEAIVDDIEEGEESFTTAIAESETYSVDPVQNQVITNLLDNGDLPTMTTVSVAAQIVSFQLEDIFIPVQGGVVSDTTIVIDQIDGLETFPDIVPLATFVKDFLNTYPNEGDFFQNISTNLSQAILENTELGFSDTVDSITVNLERQPAGIVPFFFTSEATNAPSQPSNQIVSFNLQDLLVPVQGGTVADATITVDQIDGLDAFPDIVPVADFVREFLTNYPNPNDFYQTIGTNLSEAILDNPELGFSDTADSISVELEREAAGIVPFSFSSEAIAQPTESTDKIVSFQLEDIFIPVQGGVVSDTTIVIDQIDGLETFPDIVPLATFVKDFLNTYPNEGDFFQNISTNLSEAILENTELGFADTVDAITVNLERQPAGIVPFFFTSEATNIPEQPSNQIVSFNIQDLLVPVQGGTVADATITIDQIDGLDAFPDIVPVADFVREFLTNYPNPNDFYQTISNNLSQAILDNPELGFSDTVDSISVELEREAAGIVPFNFSSEGIITIDADTEIIGDDDDNILEGTDGDNLIAGGLGNDEIFGGDGDDILRGDLNSSSSGGIVGGNDTISGGAGNDSIGGKAGDDELSGDEGDDLIYGDDGDDLIRGGLGNDILVGDDFSGGSGVDTFVLAAGEGTDTIIDFEVGVDIIGLADGLMAGDLAVTTSSGNTAIALGDETLAILEGVVVNGDDIDYAMF